jgi:hypothetical protein
MKNKNLYIGLGVAALAVIGYLVYTKKKGATTDATTKSADAPEEDSPKANEDLEKLIGGRGIVPPKKTTLSAPVESADPYERALAKNNISREDYSKIESAAINAPIKSSPNIRINREVAQLKAAEKFAKENNLNFKGYLAAKEEITNLQEEARKGMTKTKTAIQSSVTKPKKKKRFGLKNRLQEVSTATPNMDNETDTFAFNFSF